MRCIINVWIVFRCVSTWVFLCLQNNNSALEKYRNSNETKPWKHIYGIHSAYSFHISLTPFVSKCIVPIWNIRVMTCRSLFWNPFHFEYIFTSFKYILLYSDIRPFVRFHGWCNHKHETFITKQKKGTTVKMLHHSEDPLRLNMEKLITQ